MENGVHVAGTDDVYRVLVSLLYYRVDDSCVYAVDPEPAMGAGVECKSLSFDFLR